MILPAGMETFVARLESFNAAHPAGKKRPSNAKAAGKIRWPHKTPSPAELARAGFFFYPQSAAPDNTVCFHCHAILDGWEDDDNALEQHCKLSPFCAWGIITRIEQDIEDGNIPQEDPMDENLLEARRSTFANWPHEGKRGWICKTQKMSESGWYFCPTPESDDSARCCYCSLTLDGWEPKDDPRVEHQRRSPECIFFALSTAKAKKPAGGKKGRGSKGSRMSIQSNLTATSGDISMSDVNGIESATLVQNLEPEGATKTAKGSKKGAKGKCAPPKSKRKASVSQQHNAAPGSSFVEPEDDDFEVKIEQKTTQEMKGRKRKSDEMSMDINQSQADSQPELSRTPAPPSKRRATRHSVSHEKKAPISTLEFNLDGDSHLATAEEEPKLTQPKSKKTARGTRKRASSTTRKASAASTASKASLRAPVFDDHDIDAALEADLDRPLTEDEAEPSPPPLPKTKTRRLTKTRPGSRKVTASTAPVRKATRASTLPAEQDSSTNADLSTNDAEQGVDEEAVAIEIALNAVEHAKEEILVKTEEHVASKAKTRGKGTSKSAKATKKGMKTRKQDDEIDESHEGHEEPLVERKSLSGPENDQKSNRPTADEVHFSEVSVVNAVDDGECQIDSSVLIPISTREDAGDDTIANIAKAKPAKKGGKKRTAPIKKGKASVRNATAGHQIEEAMQMQLDDAKQDSTDSVIEAEVPVNHEHTEQPKLPGSPPVKEALPGKSKAARSQKGKVAKHQADGMLSPAATSSFERPEIVDAAGTTTHQQVLDLDAITPPESQHQGAEVKTLVQSTTPPALTPAVQATPKKSTSPQSSDAENRPPSARPSALRPPLTVLSPSKPQAVRVALNAKTPMKSPHKRDISRLQSTLPWAAIDFQAIFMASPAGEQENVIDAAINDAQTRLTSPEKKLTVEEWMTWRAAQGEEKLRKDCERLVGRFEGEGVRALKTLEGIVCAE